MPLLQTHDKHLAALGWLPTCGRDTPLQIALPTDLFMLTAHCAQGSQASGAGDRVLKISVTLLRTRPERFRSSAEGQLAFALLTPAGLLSVLRAPLHGISDRRLSLSQFCSPDNLRVLRDALLQESDPDLRMRLFGAWIEARIHQRHHHGAQQRRVAEAATMIQHHEGPLDLADLRRTLHVSPRQLERDFRSWLGVSPAAYARSVRFQRAAADLLAGGALSDSAARHGYADQPHLNRAFRQLACLTPRDFVQQAVPARKRQGRVLAGRVVLIDAPALPQNPVLE